MRSNSNSTSNSNSRLNSKTVTQLLKITHGQIVIRLPIIIWD